MNCITEEQLYDGSREFTWTLSKFCDLPTYEGYCIDSEKFSFANATWCLRMYPNEQIRGEDNGWMHLLLMRLHSCNTEHRIHYRFGLRSGNGKKQGTRIHEILFCANSVETGVINLLTKSDFCNKFINKRNKFVAFVHIIKVEEIGAVIPRQLPKQLQQLYGTHLSKTSKPRKKVFVLSNPEIYVWKINNFSQLPMHEDFFIDSSSFLFANATWCMRMYPNGFKESDGQIHLFLVRLHSCDSYHRLRYKLGLTTAHDEEYESLFHAVTFYSDYVKMGVLNLCTRKDATKSESELTVNNSVTAYCHFIITEEVGFLSESYIDTHLVRDTINIKQDENTTDKLNCNFELTGSNDAGNAEDVEIVDETIDEFSDFTILNGKEEVIFEENKEKYPIKKKCTEISVTGFACDTANLEMDGNNIAVEELNNNLMASSKDDIQAKAEVVDNIDELLDFTCLKKKKKKKVTTELFEKFINEDKKHEVKSAIKEVLQDKRLPNGESFVTFLVQGKEFVAYRSILKDKCTFFFEIFQCKNTNENIVVIDESDPDIFAVFFQYLHTGHFEIRVLADVFSLFSMAHKYGTLCLKVKCIEYVKSNFSCDTICDILYFSLKHQETELIQMASHFFSDNVSKIILTLNWQLFLKENRIVANRLLAKKLKKKH